MSVPGAGGAPTPAPDPRARIGHYQVLGELGRGGMGVVLRAIDPALGREVAIKVIRGSPKQAARLQREAELLARLRHPNVVRVHAAGLTPEGSPYLVMDLVVGETLEDRLQRAGSFPAREAAALCAKLARALGQAHAQGLVHRDVKPENVLVERESGEPRLTDFGLGKDLTDSTPAGLSRAGGFIGTPGFAPPEQVMGKLEQIGPWSDVHALGATLHALLTGESPFPSDSWVESARATLEQAPDPPSRRAPGVDAGLDAICARCLAKAPEERYADGNALADDLERWLRGEPVQALPDRGAASAPRAIAAGVLLLVLGAALLGASRLRSGEPAPRPGGGDGSEPTPTTSVATLDSSGLADALSQALAALVARPGQEEALRAADAALEAGAPPPGDWGRLAARDRSRLATLIWLRAGAPVPAPPEVEGAAAQLEQERARVEAENERYGATWGLFLPETRTDWERSGGRLLEHAERAPPGTPAWAALLRKRCAETLTSQVLLYAELAARCAWPDSVYFQRLRALSADPELPPMIALAETYSLREQEQLATAAELAERLAEVGDLSRAPPRFRMRAALLEEHVAPDGIPGLKASEAALDLVREHPELDAFYARYLAGVHRRHAERLLVVAWRQLRAGGGRPPELEAAVAHARTGLEASWRDDERLALAKALLFAGQAREARDVAQAIQSDSLVTERALILATAALLEGDAFTGLERLDQVIRQDPLARVRPETYVLRAQLRHALGDESGAAAALRDAQALPPRVDGRWWLPWLRPDLAEGLLAGREWWPGLQR